MRCGMVEIDMTGSRSPDGSSIGAFNETDGLPAPQVEWFAK